MYVADRKRRETKESTASLEGWLLSLKTKATIHTLNKNNINRVSQLFNKTNQLNLKTRRLSQDEIEKWVNINKKNKKIFIIEVKDRLGDLGLVGIITLEQVDSVVNIVDFILSCRVMGRKIENLMIWSNNMQSIKKVSPSARMLGVPTPLYECPRKFQKSAENLKLNLTLELL